MSIEKVIEKGGAAFPMQQTMPDGSTFSCFGMTMRDYFAAQALNGCLSYSVLNETWGDYHNNCSDSSLAEKCYRLADAMLAERKK